MTDRIHELLNCWFGQPGVADLPTSDRTNMWFGNNEQIKKELVESFAPEFDQAAKGQLTTWEESPRGRLALIILLDQFPRYLHRHSSQAFAFDKTALGLAEDGIKKAMDHSLTLIERVFFYMPLVHAEDDAVQEQSIRLYQALAGLSMPETTQIYQLFLAYAYAHFRVIKEFGRFPQRNAVLQRESTPAELDFLKNS